ncbi:MAG: hypothetical protein HPZ91_00780 [Lentisphaeria bacterium]|nr:hypothetical protein [Lentisphaeria bacterium]
MPEDGAAPRVYHDEPIPPGAARTAPLPPPEYRAMRKLALYDLPESALFYRQGKLMEEFEDEFEFHGEFMRYFPTYQAMNDRQLRGYFSWRTRVRRGDVVPAPLSFIFVYIYELLNLIGVKSAEDGFHTLKSFWLRCREFEPKIDRYVKMWLRDCAVYYDLDRSLLGELSDAAPDRAVLTLLNHEAHSADEVFRALNTLSAYNIGRSPFFRQHPEEVKNVVCGVFSRLSDYYDKNRKNGICRKFFGESRSSSCTMFRSAVFYDRLKREDFLYEINDIYKYRCRNGNWSCERFLCYKGKIQQTGALLKAVDYLMRRHYGFKSALQVEKITKLYCEIIEKEIILCRENARPEIEIDLSRLGAIRAASRETRDRLIVEELEGAAAPEEPERPAKPENPAGLSGVERRFLRCLLAAEPYEPLLRNEGTMLSLLVDSINEKLFDTFGDTVIVFEGDAPGLLEDYKDELKGIIGR